MIPDAMTFRLHLRRIQVVAVVVDLIEKLVIEAADTRRVVRCEMCGFKTGKVYDWRRVHDLPPGEGQRRWSGCGAAFSRLNSQRRASEGSTPASVTQRASP